MIRTGMALAGHHCHYEWDRAGRWGERKKKRAKQFCGLSGLEGGEWNAYENWRAENNISGIAFPMYDSEHNLIGE